MTETIRFTWDTIGERVAQVAHLISAGLGLSGPRIYGVPNGGIIPSVMVKEKLGGRLVEVPDHAHVFIDDIIDSGETRALFQRRFPDVPFLALVNKPVEKITKNWVSFPWERMATDQGDGVQDNIRRVLQFIGEDPKREGLLETPARVERSLKELYSGYTKDPAKVMTVFEDGSCDEMVVLRDIEFCSMCEHHMLPFLGTAHIAYIPNGKVIGVSKLARILEIYSRRLQIQERLCQQVTTALMTHLDPKGAACVLEAKHLCMTCRGVNKQHSIMMTSSLQGVFREQAVRNEFLSMIGKR